MFKSKLENNPDLVAERGSIFPKTLTRLPSAEKVDTWLVHESERVAAFCHTGWVGRLPRKISIQIDGTFLERDSKHFYANYCSTDRVLHLYVTNSGKTY